MRTICLMVMASGFIGIGMFAGRARAESFGIHFLGNTTASVTSAAGVVHITNWNNVANTTFSSGAIHSSDGSSMVTLALNGSGSALGWNSPSAHDGSDGSLMSGYLDASLNAAATVTINGLPASCYTVYLYTAGDSPRPSNNGDRLPNYTVNGIRYDTATLGGAFSKYAPGGFTLVNTNQYPPSLAYGNYLRIDAVVPMNGSITISANADNHSFRSPLNGIELIADDLPADIAMGAFNSAFLVQSGELTYYVNALNDAAYGYFWGQALDIEGLQDACDRTQSPQQLALINNLLRTFLVQYPLPWSWDTWNDDIGWAAIAMARGYRLTGNTNFLNAAENGFNLAFARGWDSRWNGGGIWEMQVDDGKNPLSNDSLAQAACLIYEGTSNSVYLARAQQIYSWVRTNIFNPATGQVYASISTNGTVDRSPQLYNQGTFIDLANYLYQITGEAMYYTDALNAVEYTRNNLTVNSIFSNDATYLYTWAAEYARGLGHFVAQNNLWNTYYPWMRANADAAWAMRRTDLNLTWNAWVQPTPTTNSLTAGWCASAVAMLQMTPTNQPGLVPCTNQLGGMVVGTPGSFGNSDNTIARVFDGDLATFFDASVASGAWVGLDLGAAQVIGQISYWPRAGFSGRMLGGVFQGANNSVFINPVTLFTIPTAPPENAVVTTRTITNKTAFRYVRYLGPNNGWANVAELQFFAPNALPSLVLTHAWNGTELTLGWQSGAVLLETTNIRGPWTTNTAAVSPWVVMPDQPQKFYRVQAP